MRKGMLTLLALGLLLSGCSGETAAKDMEEGTTPETAVYGMSASQVEWDFPPLPEEEILDAYQRAVRVYSWFETSPLSGTGEVVTVDGVLYQKVGEEGLSEMSSLRAYLRSVFSQELADRLLESGGAVRYRDIHGELYVAGEGRSWDESKGETDIQIQQTGENAYSVNVTVELLDAAGAENGLECWSFPYTFEGDRWVFSEFQLVN
jgi:hypothetical protein